MNIGKKNLMKYHTMHKKECMNTLEPCGSMALPCLPHGRIQIPIPSPPRAVRGAPTNVVREKKRAISMS